MRITALVAMVAVMGIAAGMAEAGTITFDDPSQYVLVEPWTYSNPQTFELSSLVNLGGEHGNAVSLSLGDATGDGNDWVDASVKCLGTFGKVSDTNITFETYIASATGTMPQNQPPYSYLGVDVNGNGAWDGSGGGDALIIPWEGIGTPVYQQWYTDGYDSTTRVHVWQNGNNVDFGGGAISTNMTDLSNQQCFSTGKLWGDLNVVSIYVGAGTWDADGFGYTAYVDNVQFTPEPATMGLLTVGGLALLRRRRK